MRIFIGIKLDSNAIEQIEKFLKPFKKINTPIRWIKPETVHITLKFIGEVPDTQYQKIQQTLSEALAALNPGAFDVTFSGCGKFGKRDSLNIFWVGIEPEDTLKRIYETVEDSLSRLGIPGEDREFKPHITVGRNKREYNFKSLFSLIEQYSDQRIQEMHVTRIQIFKSDLNPDGPVYTILKEIPLARV
jgi:2'-5' RNA ligase